MTTQRLFSTGDLQRMYGTSQPTIVRALNRLTAAGVVIDRVGRDRAVRADQLPLVTAQLIRGRVNPVGQPTGAAT